MRKAETKFRTSKIDPFLKKLQNTSHYSIQQVSIRGDADKFLCCNGHFIWLEIKTDEGDEDPLQEYKRSECHRCKGIVIVARPHNWEEVKDFLTLLDRGIYDKNVLRAINTNKIS